MLTCGSAAKVRQPAQRRLHGHVQLSGERAPFTRRSGDIVLAFAGWQTHAVADARHTRRLEPDAAPVPPALCVLGMPGFTTYVGLIEIGRPRPGETVVVAAATGPVGSAAGPIARVKGSPCGRHR